MPDKLFSILIPHDAGDPQRDKVVAWTSARLRHYLPEAEVLVGGIGKQNRSANRNMLAQQASTDLLAFLDADVALAIDPFRKAVLTASKDAMTKYSGVVWINKSGTDRLIKRPAYSRLEVDKDMIDHTSDTLCGLVFIMHRELMEEVNGWDERFTGWGVEDQAFTLAVETMVNPVIRTGLPAYHLWHGRGAEHDKKSASFLANRELGRRYWALFHAQDRDGMRELVNER